MRWLHLVVGLTCGLAALSASAITCTGGQVPGYTYGLSTPAGAYGDRTSAFNQGAYAYLGCSAPFSSSAGQTCSGTGNTLVSTTGYAYGTWDAASSPYYTVTYKSSAGTTYTSSAGGARNVSTQPTCVTPPVTCTKKDTQGPYVYHVMTAVQASSTSECSNGCKVDIGPVTCKPGSYGVYAYECISQAFHFSGVSCVSDPNGVDYGVGAGNPQTPDATGTCPAGSTGGEVNGQHVCVPKQPDGTVTPQCSSGQVPQSVNGAMVCAAPAGGVSTGGTTTINVDGSTTTITNNTTCASGQCTTTTVAGGTNADGTGKTPSTTASTADQNSYCAAHASDPACKGTGDDATVLPCATGIAYASDICDGDALQCAQLKEANTLRCAEQKRFDDLTGTSYTVLGTQVLAGNDPAQSSLPTQANGSNVDLGSLPLDQSGWLGGGSCPGDRSIALPNGASFSIGFSLLCDGNVVYPLRALMLVMAGVASLATLRRALTS